MGVDVGGSGKIAVSQPLLNLLERHAVGKEQTGATVAQIVEAHAF